MTNSVLSGPILRRTTQNRVCVWLVTSKSIQLQLSVYDTDKNLLGTGGMDDMNPPGIQIGDHLFVHLLQARPGSECSSAYPLDTLMFYRVDRVSDEGTSPLFSDEETRQLSYGEDALPSFFIPSMLKNLLHGSCRKPYGRSPSADALSYGHQLIKETYNDLNKRPAILLLTGDQIYADDVAISLSATLRKQAIELTGKTEEMPVKKDKQQNTEDKQPKRKAMSSLIVVGYFNFKAIDKID